MKVAILAGGAGTRLAEETSVRPKPMVEIGGRPILWHIMRGYAQHGYRQFVVALGHLGHVISEYFEAGGRICDGKVVFDPDGPGGKTEPWEIELVPTGLDTETGGRLLRLRPWLGEVPFMLTWGDGVADLDIRALVAFHRSHHALATVTAVHPPSRFGTLDLDGNRVRRFMEKPPRVDDWINGAFFVLEPGVFAYIEGDSTSWERGPMSRLAAEGQLMAYRHDGFWQCMDTMKEKNLLEALCSTRGAPWMTWTR